MKNSNIKKIVIIGASGGSADVCDILTDINEREKTFDVLGYLDDDEKLQGQLVYGKKILGGTKLIDSLKNDVLFIIGSHFLGPSINKIFKNCFANYKKV